MTTKNRKRMIYFLVFIILFIIEVLIALFVHDNFIRPFLGDVLVVAVIYFFFRMLIPERVRLLAIYIFFFAAFIEFMQYIQLVNILGLSNNSVARVIIGSTFDWADILCYGVGTMVLFGVDMIAYKNKSK